MAMTKAQEISKKSALVIAFLGLMLIAAVVILINEPVAHPSIIVGEDNTATAELIVQNQSVVATINFINGTTANGTIYGSTSIDFIVQANTSLNIVNATVKTYIGAAINDTMRIANTSFGTIFSFKNVPSRTITLNCTGYASDTTSYSCPSLVYYMNPQIGFVTATEYGNYVLLTNGSINDTMATKQLMYNDAKISSLILYNGNNVSMVLSKRMQG